MAFVIYNRETIKLMRSRLGATHFEKESTAKRVLTNAAKKDKNFDPTKWKIDTPENWRAADYEIEVINSRFGTKVKIMKSQHGVAASDPSTEGYWTM